MVVVERVREREREGETDIGEGEALIGCLPQSLQRDRAQNPGFARNQESPDLLVSVCCFVVFNR